MGYKLIFLNVSGVDIWENEETPIDSLRTDEKGFVSCEDESGYTFVAAYD